MTSLEAKAKGQAPKKLEAQDLKGQDLENKTTAETAHDTATGRLKASKQKKTKPSRLRKVGRVIAHHPRITQLVLLLAFISGTSVFLLYSLFKGAWSPEQDNLKILSTILEMEVSRESTIAIEGDNNQVLTRSFQSLEPYVEEDGWTWVNRFGSTITYRKQEQTLIASCSPYSPLYMICSLSEIP